MPARQPFTTLCQALARGRAAGRADLHLHTTHSDGSYTAAQIVDLARRSGLAAIAVTDHDTVSALPEARLAALGSQVEIVAGVEITAEFQGRELHLLGYFFDADNVDLLAALARLRLDRRDRFQEMIERLRRCGVLLEQSAFDFGDQGHTLGRRNLA